ncbi:MAG: serine hydrolase domain-containing protein [Stackebrandtia sp.]
MTGLDTTVRRLISSGPESTAGSPAGAALGLRTATATVTGVAGSRTAGSDPRPMTVDTSHDLASVTKVVATTASLISLVSQGAVRLDDPVTDYLPEFSSGGKDTVTITDLLRHRGGLWEWQPLYLGDRAEAAAFDYAVNLPLRYAPGSGRHYSDLGFMLLGRVVEIAAGERLDAAVRELVTEPLEMPATWFGEPHNDNVATSAFSDHTEQTMVDTGVPHPVLSSEGFTGWRHCPIDGEVNDGNAFHAFGGVSGHAGLFSTLDDLLTFTSRFAHYRDHTELWDPAVVETFLTDGPDAGQVLGFRTYPISIDGATTTVYGHPGFVGCAIGFAPTAGLGLVWCGNRLLTHHTPVRNDDLWEQVLAAASARLAGTDFEPERC